MGNLEKVLENGIRETRYQYDALGRVTKRTLFQGAETTYQYDALGQVLAQTEQLPDGTKVQLNYQYDAVGNVLQERRTGTEGTVLRTYQYDAKNQLIRAEEGEGIRTYTYDAWSNRIQKTTNGVVTSYQYNAKNQLLEEQTGTEQIKYRYDARGNRIEKSKTGEPVVRYTYNEANQLQGMENGTTQITVGYDSFGNRTHTNVTVDGVVKRSETYLLDPLGDAGEILGWKNELTQERIRFVYGEELLSGSNGSTAWTYQTDRLSSVIGCLDASGILIEELWYEEFGTRTAQNGTISFGPTFGFTGYLYEEDTGLYDARARYYDPELGGFLEEDPEPGRAGDALQRNRYGYCWNNPVRYRDPSGKSEIAVTIQEFLDWMSSGGGTGLTAVEEALVAALGTAASAVAPYVAITVGVVTLFVVLEDNRPVTIICVPENQRNIFLELEQDGISISQSLFPENVISKVLYNPQENKNNEINPQMGLIVLDGSSINLIPETNISMSKNKKEGNDKAKTKRKDKTNKENNKADKYEKASWWERFTKRKANVDELKANPLDEFSNPKIGPSESAISKYIKQINQNGKVSKPIEVQKLSSGGYEIVNGHHRWLAAIKVGLKKVPIKIKNYLN